MSVFSFQVPLNSGSNLPIELATGAVLFILGANGTGKSSLIHRFFSANTATARRISAHRQTWFPTGAVAITGAQRRETENSLKSWDSDARARWLEHGSEQRTQVAVYDLVHAENLRARGIAEAFDADDLSKATELRRSDAPLKVLNEILRLSALPIEILLGGSEEVSARKNGGTPYSIAELSDGERNVLLLAASVLTAPAGTLFLIDEPERHIHRSISSRLLSQLFARRSDCAFVISTHDVMLCLDNPGAKVLLARSCSRTGPHPSHITWDADLLDAPLGLDDQLVGEILGARRKALFVEGTPQSLDQQLYSLLFPGASVIAKASCRDVEQAVVGIRSAANLHWVHAYGIVDGDGRTAEDKERLMVGGIFPLDVFAVESVYYDAGIIERVAKRQANVTGEDVGQLVADAKTAALKALLPQRQKLCERVVEKSVRDTILRSLPGLDAIAVGNPIDLSVDVQAIVGAELSRFDKAHGEADLAALVRRYPVRHSSALADIAKRLGFSDRDKYEAAVRKLLIDDEDALTLARGFFGKLATELS